jgi:uncharacterized membrane protein
MVGDKSKVSRSIIYFPYHLRILTIFFILLVIVASLFFVGLMGLAFRRLGLPPGLVMIILISAFLFSSINIPLGRLKTRRMAIVEGYVDFFGIRYHIPMLKEVEDEMIIAINVGGALIPTIFSLYLILRLPFLLERYLIAIMIVTLSTYLVARPIKGVGIVTPALIPPITAALSAWIVSPFLYTSFVAYVSGTLGTLIGADLLNIPRLKDLEAKIVSIGGAGTFDGIFLSGIIAVLLS